MGGYHEKILFNCVKFCPRTFSFFPMSVAAASNQYDIPELGLEVTIPEGYAVITRDTLAGDPIFNELGTTQTAILDQFEASNIYLNAISHSSNEEIVVTMTENMKCNHILPDDSEFCQYCGSRIEKLEVIPKADTNVMVGEAAAAAASDGPVMAPTSAETPKQSAEEVVAPLPGFENMGAYEAQETMPDFYAQETIVTVNTNSQSQPDRISEMDFGSVSKKARKAKKVKEPKKKYCSRCGSLIDHQSKQCTGCGKKYFKGIRFNKFSVAITVLSLVIAALIGLNVFQYLYNSWITEELYKKHISIENLEVEIENLERKNADLKKEVSELKMKVQSQRITISNNDQAIERLRAEISEYTPLVRFCEEYVEVIGNDGTDTYHKYGCKYLDISQGFLILNTDAAKIGGFIECPYCRYS